MTQLEWRSIQCGLKEVNLAVLSQGQSFRWKKATIENEIVWQGVMGNRIWQVKSSDEERISFRILGRFSRCPSTTALDDQNALINYFQLDRFPCLDHLYSEWFRVDPHLKSVAARTPGIRVLRQDPIECLFSFICSTNNNIKRITSMVETMCRLFGESLDCQAPGGAKEEIRKNPELAIPVANSHDESILPLANVIDGPITETFYDFPTVTRLAQPDVELALRSNGFGYRAKYIASTARMLLDEYENEEEIGRVFNDLRMNGTLDQCTQLLLKLNGVGPKVADCVSLMSLDKMDAVPIDTHVRRITGERYLPNLKTVSLTRKTYKEIGSFYRNLFGQYAGWAHSILYSDQVGGKR